MIFGPLFNCIVIMASTVYEEDLPVIVRRRGCWLRVRIVDTDPDWRSVCIRTPFMFYPHQYLYMFTLTLTIST